MATQVDLSELEKKILRYCINERRADRTYGPKRVIENLKGKDQQEEYEQAIKHLVELSLLEFRQGRLTPTQSARDLNPDLLSERRND